MFPSAKDTRKELGRREQVHCDAVLDVLKKGLPVLGDGNPQYRGDGSSEKGDLEVLFTELGEFFENGTGERAKALGLNDQVATFFDNIEERGPYYLPSEC